MFLGTGLPRSEEREEALALVPRLGDLQKLVGVAGGTLENQAVDLIDATAGTGNHARAALVALHEGLGALFRASLDLAESVVQERYFARITPLDWRTAKPLGQPDRGRYAAWAGKYELEAAVVLVASAGDHLANAHLRLAWEANAALPGEVNACRFDPNLPEPKTWSSARDLRNGLRKARRQPLGIFDSFELNKPFRRFYASPAVRDTRRLRDEVVHRARPSYREAPAFGRTTLWTEGRISLKYPPPPERLQELPTLSDRRKLVSAAIESTLEYGEACWDLAVRWLRTIEVWVTPEKDTVKVQLNLGAIAGELRVPREKRDPGPFLRA